MIRQFATRVAAVLMSPMGATASAQSYPTWPVAILVPFAAGGPTAIVARSVADANVGIGSASHLCGSHLASEITKKAPLIKKAGIYAD